MTGAKRIAIAVGFSLMVLGGFQPAYFRVYAWDRATLRTLLTETPYRKLPGYRVFLEGVRQRTPDGAKIFLAFPIGYWRQGYEYPYGRAAYVLTGRQVLPQITEFEQRHPDLLHEARYVAAWDIDPSAFPRFRVVWRHGAGILLERTP